MPSPPVWWRLSSSNHTSSARRSRRPTEAPVSSNPDSARNRVVKLVVAELDEVLPGVRACEERHRPRPRLDPNRRLRGPSEADDEERGDRPRPCADEQAVTRLQRRDRLHQAGAVRHVIEARVTVQSDVALDPCVRPDGPLVGTQRAASAAARRLGRRIRRDEHGRGAEEHDWAEGACRHRDAATHE
jgi:hypothetical protein